MKISLRLAALCGFLLTGSYAQAQLSFSTAVDLALRNSPRIKVAESEVKKALSGLQESRDVYIPAVSIGSGLGYTYGFPIGQPSVYNASLQSLIFDYSQRNYVRSAKAALEAANLSLRDVRQQIAEDTANTYVALDADQMRVAALTEELGYARRVVEIMNDRVAAGQDPLIDLTRAQLQAAQITLHRVQIEDDLNVQQDHLARLTGLNNTSIATRHESIPPVNASSPMPDEVDLPLSIQAAYKSADSRLQEAFGDERKMYRPTMGLGIQYSRFARFNNYEDYYNSFQVNNFQLGLQMSLPLFDFTKRAHARGTLADATRLRHEADLHRDQFFEGRLKQLNAEKELTAQADVARLQRQLAQDQLDIVTVQMQNGGSAGKPVTPKEEGNAHIEERQRYLEMLNADMQLRQAEISLLRSTNRLESWLRRAIDPSASTTETVTPSGQQLPPARSR